MVDCSTSEVNQVLAWPQRKRAAVVRLQQQLLEARAVLAKHSGIGRLMGVLEAEALRKRTDSELDQQQQSAQPQPQPVADSGVARGSQDGIQEEEAEGSGGVAAINVPNAEAAEEMSLLQSEVHKNDEQQRVNDEEQRELLDRVERLQKQLDTDKLDEAEQRKMIVEIRARAAQHGRSRSSPQTTMRAADAGGGTRGVHPSAYTVLEKSLKQQDITLKETIARSQLLNRQLDESRHTIASLKLSNERLRTKGVKMTKDFETVQQHQREELAQSRRHQAAAKAEQASVVGTKCKVQALLERLVEAEKAMKYQSSDEGKILKQLANLTKASDEAKAADVTRKKQVASLTAQLNDSKLNLKQAQDASKRERERLQQTNTELADSATAHARSASAARKKLKTMEQELEGAKRSSGHLVEQALQKLKEEAEALALEKEEALTALKQLKCDHQRGTSQLATVEAELRDATEEVAMLQRELSVRAQKTAENTDLRAQVDQARGEMENSMYTAKIQEEAAFAAERKVQAAADQAAADQLKNMEQQKPSAAPVGQVVYRMAARLPQLNSGIHQHYCVNLFKTTCSPALPNPTTMGGLTLIQRQRLRPLEGTTGARRPHALAMKSGPSASASCARVGPSHLAMAGLASAATTPARVAPRDLGGRVGRQSRRVQTIS